MNIVFNSAMPGYKVRRQRFGISSLALMLFLGILFMVIGMKLISSDKIDPSWKRIQGKVTSSTNNFSGGSETHNAIVKYTVAGKPYETESSTGSSALPAIGSTRQVAYDPSNPQNAKVVDGAGTKAFLYITLAVGVLLIVLGLVLFIRSLRRSKDIGSLKRGGQKIQGVLVDIQTNGAGNVANNTGNNSNQYRLVVAATDANGNARNYTSDWLAGIAGLSMIDYRTNPIPMDVYIDPTNPDNYYVDISEVPKLTPERIKELISQGLHRQQQPRSFVSQQTPGSTQPTRPTPPTPAPTPVTPTVIQPTIPQPQATPEAPSQTPRPPITPHVNQ